MTQYNPHNIEKTLKRMEKSDELKGIHRSGTNIMSFFDDNDEEYKLQKQQSAAEVKKDEYLKSVELLKSFIKENGTNKDLKRIIAIGLLIETTDFLNITSDRKKILKENMNWCNLQYEKYINEN
jgi:hypothetical protein